MISPYAEIYAQSHILPQHETITQSDFERFIVSDNYTQDSS